MHQELSDELDEKVKFVSWMHLRARNAADISRGELCSFFLFDDASFYGIMHEF